MAIVRSGAKRWAVIAAVALLPTAGPAWGQGAFSVRGKVAMEDGSPPPKPAIIERVCPGESPVEEARTDKKGEYGWIATWRSGSSCAWRAVMDEYASAATDSLAAGMPAFVLRKEANEAVPRAARQQWDSAVKATEAGNWREAEGILRSILAEYPDSAPVWTALGIALANQRKPADARRAFEWVIENNPGYVRAYHLLATLEMDTDDWQAAARTAAAGIRADPDGSAPVLYLDVAEIRQHLKIQGAEAAARKAIELDRKHEIPRAELVLGTILESDGDYHGAAAHMLRYLEQRPNAPDGASVRARVQRLEQTIAAEAAVPDRETEAVPAGAALVAVPGGLKALAAMAYLSRTPSRADFFLEYCRAIVASFVSHTAGGNYGDPLTETYLAPVAEMSGMGARLRTFQIAIPSGRATLIEARAWTSLAGSLPPGGFAGVFVHNPQYAKTYAGLAAMGPPAAAALVSGVGLRTKRVRHRHLVDPQGGRYLLPDAIASLIAWLDGDFSTCLLNVPPEQSEHAHRSFPLRLPLQRENNPAVARWQGPEGARPRGIFPIRLALLFPSRERPTMGLAGYCSEYSGAFRRLPRRPEGAGGGEGGSGGLVL